MFTRSKLRTQRQQNSLFIFSVYFLFCFIIFSISVIDSQLPTGVNNQVIYLVLKLIVAVAFMNLSIWLIRNKAYKGLKYAIYHYYFLLQLRKALLNGGHYNKRLYFNIEIADLPNIKLNFHDNYSKATLLIENINITKNIRDVNLTFALKNFVIDRAYLSSNELYYVFEISDSRISHQFKFESVFELNEHTSKNDDYTLMIDKSVSIPLYGTLLVGQTGSGKTYALYSLILQMLAKDITYNLYFADPKNSSLAVLGEQISLENTATDIEDIIKILQRFNSEMEARKKDIKKDLSSKLEATYADFNYNPYVFIFDEFASFQTVLQTMEKKRRDEVMKLLSQVVLQGRQLGFFLWIVMQKSDATLLPTNLRENLPLKFVLGNAEKQTYTTAFGTGVDIPEKDLSLGQGIFTCPNIASTPKVCHFSYLDFDVLEAVKYLKS